MEAPRSTGRKKTLTTDSSSERVLFIIIAALAVTMIGCVTYRRADAEGHYYAYRRCHLGAWSIVCNDLKPEDQR